MPSFMAFSARARSQMSDPLAAAASDGSARPPSPRAILGPGTGRLPAPNGAERDASDDGMSSVGLGEAEARQQFLDAAAAPFLAATGTGVHNEAGEELYTDDTFRPVSSPAADRPNRGAPPEYYDIATDQDADVAVEPADSTQGRKRLADRAGTEQRSTSPRRAIADHSPDSSPELLDGSSDEEPATPRTRSRRTENSVTTSSSLVAELFPCVCKRSHVRDICQGAETSKTGFYTTALSKKIITGLLPMNIVNPSKLSAPLPVTH